MQQSGKFVRCMAFDLVTDTTRLWKTYLLRTLVGSLFCFMFDFHFQLSNGVGVAVAVHLLCDSVYIRQNNKPMNYTYIYTSIRINCTLCMRTSPWIARSLTLVVVRLNLYTQRNDNNAVTRQYATTQQHRAAVILNMDMHVLAQYIQWN